MQRMILTMKHFPKHIISCRQTQTIIPAGRLPPKKYTSFLKLKMNWLMPIFASSIGGSRRGRHHERFTHNVLPRASFQCHHYGNEPEERVCCRSGIRQGSPTADVVNNLTAIQWSNHTDNQFDDETDISSIMGIEQYLCVRLGDTGFPHRQLQVQTLWVNFPTPTKTPTSSGRVVSHRIDVGFEYAGDCFLWTENCKAEEDTWRAM